VPRKREMIINMDTLKRMFFQISWRMRVNYYQCVENLCITLM